jgi:MDMPI C-terminal domain
VPYREFMRVRVMDCWVHEQDMRVATARPGHREGPSANLAVDRLASAMPFIVGKKAGAPDGSSVRFELTGIPPRRLEVVVRGGRASLDDLHETDPTAEIRMDLEVFWRLGCGRVTGEAARGAGLVELRGDTELGERVVDTMAFMI